MKTLRAQLLSAALIGLALIGLVGWGTYRQAVPLHFLLVVQFLAFGGFVFWVLKKFSPLPEILRQAQNPNHLLDPHADTFDHEWGELETALANRQRQFREHEKSETALRQQFQQLLNSLSDPLLVVASDSTCKFYNQAFQNTFIGQPLPLKLPLGTYIHLPEFLTWAHTCINHPEKSLNPIVIKDDRGRHFQVRATRIESGLMMVLHDISETRAVEQMRIDFVANVSHELRSPLTAIYGFSENLAATQGNLSEPDRDAIEIIQRNSQRLLRLVNDLLDLSAIESGVELQIQNVAVESLSTMVIRNIKEKWQSRNPQLELKVLATYVEADPVRLEQVLVNLIENAILHTPPATPIEVLWDNDDVATSHVRLQVIDQGPGIATEHLPRLFERFYRVNKDRSRQSGGTGLGLSIVKHIVARHGGTVEVRSSTPGGSRFICLFPRHTSGPGLKK